MNDIETESTLPTSAQRVQNHLRERGFTCNVVEISQSTRTAAEAAAAVGCQLAQIAKSLIFRNITDDKPVLVVASGANRVDVGEIERRTELRLGKASGAYVKNRVGFAIGGIPPVAHTTPLHTILDRDLTAFDRIWAAAGTPRSLFSLTPADLQAMTQGIWIDLAERER